MKTLYNAYSSRFHFAARLVKEAIQDCFRDYWGINSLDRRLARLMPYSRGYFVELGANDGRSQSNSLHFERHKKWRGMLVEPCPTAYMRCVMTRSKNTSIYCGCCVEPEKAGGLIPMEYFNLMSVQTDGGSTFASEGNIEELRLNKGGEPDLAYRFGSYSYTLTQLLQQANAPMRIDFLSLDVEGAELSVIKGIDFNRYSFEYILIETSQAQAVSQLLEVHNYILFESLTKVDLLFRRREANVLSA
jgi:FkbM family methyltransferase